MICAYEINDYLRCVMLCVPCITFPWFSVFLLSYWSAVSLTEGCFEWLWILARKWLRFDGRKLWFGNLHSLVIIVLPSLHFLLFVVVGWYQISGERRYMRRSVVCLHGKGMHIWALRKMRILYCCNHWLAHTHILIIISASERLKNVSAPSGC